MNWTVIFDDHEEGWRPASAIISTEDDIFAREAIKQAHKRLESLFPLDGYRTVKAFQTLS